MGHAITDALQHQFWPYREVDANVAVRALEEGEGRDERRKQRAWEVKNKKLNITYFEGAL